MRKILLALPTALLAACGGSSSSNPTDLVYLTVELGGQRTFAVTDVDDANNVVDLTQQETVTALNQDGTFVVSVDDPNDTSVTAGGTTYSVVPAVITNDASGRELQAVYSPANAASYTCTETPHGVGPAFPIAVGQVWQLTYVENCGSANITYQQSGSVVDEEDVVVPLGTYAALRLQSTLTWTTAIGTQVTASITRWVDASTGRTVKVATTYARSGTLPGSGYLVSQTLELTAAD